MFANRDNPQLFLLHDINFHRGVADAAKNPIVGTLVGMVSALYYERRRATAERASDSDLRDAAEAHRRIYQAIRARDAAGARRAMNEHLLQASRYQAAELDRLERAEALGTTRRRRTPGARQAK
jgi:GntR family transcriptional repressor for pyruvate dehydrogenase complex